MVSEVCVDAELEGSSTEPLRFSDIDLAEREASYGRTGFSMQFMLDTRLSDIDRFPLEDQRPHSDVCGPRGGPREACVGTGP